MPRSSDIQTTVYMRCAIATMAGGSEPFGWIPDGALVTYGKTIVWVGPRSALPARYRDAKVVTLDGRTVTPALIDCHTHLVYGGHRAHEFAMRLRGVSYESIARQGGGILATVQATRAASEDELVASALPRLDALLSEGVATVEIKSGYGLNPGDERKMLRAARRLATIRPVRIVTSWLAAHATAPEYQGRTDAYLQDIVLDGLRAAHAEGLVDAVDGFCESIAFGTSQIARLFDVATELRLPTRLHAEQLSNLGGAKLAASYGALAADHLEYLDEEGARAMAAAGTVAVLLPGAYYTLRQSKKPPVAMLRALGIPMAVGTDANPGSSPLFSLLLAMNMACTLFGLTPEEALAGVTTAAAQALGMGDRCGTLSGGKRADIAVWDVEHPTELPYHMGLNPLAMRVFGGVTC